MNILVTGAAGFIGCHLCRELVRQGHHVRGLLLPVEQAESLEALGVEIVRGDLTRPDSIEGVAKDMDMVFHLAARTSDWGTFKQFEAIMVEGTQHILQAAAKDISRFAYYDSMEELGYITELIQTTLFGITIGMPGWMMRIGRLIGDVNLIK